MAAMGDRIAVFRALSDETRLRMLVLLSRRVLCVCEIERVLGLPQSRVSRHLAALRGAGLVAGRRKGRWVYYALFPPRNELERALQGCLRACFNGVPAVKRDMRRLGDMRPMGPRGICARRRRRGG
jgi:ArsR family transcriptional regulator